MTNSSKSVVFVGGSHSIHVKIPAGIIRNEGYRVTMADLQLETQSDAFDVFDQVYNLNGSFEKKVLNIRALCGKQDAGIQDGLMTIEKPLQLKSYLWNLTQAWLRAKRLTKIVEKERPGIVYFQSMTAGGMIAYYLLKSLGWPKENARPGLITHLWGYRPRYHGNRIREIKVLKFFDHIHSSSPAIVKMYKENYEVPEDKLSFFVRGININSFGAKPDSVLQQARKQWNIPEDKFVIIHNRHLHPMYRVDIAVEAFIELVKQGHDVFLMLIRGNMYDRDYERCLLDMLKNNGCQDRVSSIEPTILTPDQMAVALQLADCAVNCVPFDAFGISIIEAMYCRTVPVVRNLESYIQFIKDGQTAFAVGVSVSEYVEKIKELIKKPRLRKKLAENGFELVAQEGTEQIYRRKILDLVERCWHNW